MFHSLRVITIFTPKLLYCFKRQCNNNLAQSWTCIKTFPQEYYINNVLTLYPGVPDPFAHHSSYNHSILQSNWTVHPFLRLKVLCISIFHILCLTLDIFYLQSPDIEILFILQNLGQMPYSLLILLWLCGLKIIFYH